MSDLIERETVINALDKHCEAVCEYSKAQRSVMCGACPLGTAFDVIEALPSVHPETVTEFADRCRECGKMLNERLEKNLSEVLDSIKGEIDDKWEKMHRRWQRNEISDKQRTYQMYVYKEVCEIIDKYGKEQTNGTR